MKKFLMALMVLAIVSAPALAGPNENGVLVVHNTGLVYTNDLPMPPQSELPLPADPCPGSGTFVNTVPMGTGPQEASAVAIWKIYAAFPIHNNPRLKATVFGVHRTSTGGGAIVTQTHGTPSDAFATIPVGTWPDNGSELAVAITDSVRLARVTELYWFVGYAYAGLAGEPQTFAIVPSAVPSNQVFVDDSTPGITDPIAGYGSLGFGVAGDTPCPGVVLGACCFADGTCQLLTAADCVAAGGAFNGGACDPNPCHAIVYGACCDPAGLCNVVTPEICANVGGTYQGDGTDCATVTCAPVPVERTSWGQIKADYR